MLSEFMYSKALLRSDPVHPPPHGVMVSLRARVSYNSKSMSRYFVTMNVKLMESSDQELAGYILGGHCTRKDIDDVDDADGIGKKLSSRMQQRSWLFP